MTLKEIKTALGLTALGIYPAKDAEGNTKTGINGEPIYKFLGYVDGEKTLNGSVSQAAAKQLKKNPYSGNYQLTSFSGENGPVPQITISNAIAFV